MAVNDNDVELLHEYIDGELPVAECEGLWRRLAIERELMGELDRLRTDHAARTMVWNSLEPDESTVARLEAKIMRATRREDLMSWGSNILRIVASAAALILFGFTVGWMGRDRYSGVPVVAHPSQGESAIATSNVGGSPASLKYNVEFFDRNGKLLNIQQFNSKEEAEQFKHDFDAAQASPGGSDWNVVPTINKF
jgi:carotenoid cleavage dioxygenase-like enzyme